MLLYFSCCRGERMQTFGATVRKHFNASGILAPTAQTAHLLKLFHDTLSSWHWQRNQNTEQFSFFTSPGLLSVRHFTKDLIQTEVLCNKAVAMPGLYSYQIFLSGFIMQKGFRGRLDMEEAVSALLETPDFHKTHRHFSTFCFYNPGLFWTI